MNKPYKYIHIPKTGGVSIKHSGIVTNEDWNNHKMLSETENWNNFFTFSFIRNPYEKVFSSYLFYTTKGSVKKSTQAEIKKYNSFENFVLDYENSKNIDKEHFLYTQFDYISIDGEIKVDYYGMFSDLENEIKKVLCMNGEENREIEIPHKNKTNSKKWKDFYTDELAEIIYNSWEVDFDFFKFKKYSYKK